MKQKAALVLSGGSAQGLSHIGVLKHLSKHYEFDAIYGVSAGAIVGALLAHGWTPEQIEQQFFDANIIRLGLDPSKMDSGLIRGKRIRDYLDTLLDHKNIEDLSVPFSAGAVDFVNGEYTQITSGSIADALRASFSLPLIFEPYMHPAEQRHLVDGGLVQNLPLREAVKEYQGDTIIALNAYPLTEYKGDIPAQRSWGLKKSITPFLRHAFNIMIKAQHQDISDPRLVMIEPDLSSFSTSTLKAETHRQIIRAGEEAGKAFIDSR